MTVGEANAVNAVIRYFLDVPGLTGRADHEDALNALLIVREAAFKKLMAGPRESEVREAFERYLARSLR